MTSVEVLAIMVGVANVAHNILESIEGTSDKAELCDGLKQVQRLTKLAIASYYKIDNPPEKLTDLFLDIVQDDKLVTRLLENVK